MPRTTQANKKKDGQESLEVKLWQSADKLLYQSDRCEASLHRTRIELAALTAESSETSVSAVTETFEKTINQAKEVREELKRLGYQTAQTSV